MERFYKIVKIKTKKELDNGKMSIKMVSIKVTINLILPLAETIEEESRLYDSDNKVHYLPLLYFNDASISTKAKITMHAYNKNVYRYISNHPIIIRFIERPGRRKSD